MWLLHSLISNKKCHKAVEFKTMQTLVSTFLSNFTLQQLTSEVGKLYQIGKNYSEYLISINKPIHGIRPLREAIVQSRDSREQVSPFHREFAKLCIKSKCYVQALSIIESPITLMKKCTQPIDIIVYNYYRGVIFTALKRN
mmetsp:Transcript_6432/g.4846  ORF Transcript_6432/g.4846 Transcript_6432/m.4846 type:complete len:141 (+) Transcript_6432:179-601(+)